MKLFKVGFLGAGPVTQSIHLPVLATMPDRFSVTQMMDVDETVASIVAGRCGARAHSDATAVLDDPDVDVIAICSPNAFHAQQVIDACRAGKRAVLCEKPLAVTRAEAAAIATAAKASGTAIFVGTMHAYDPGYRAARAAWEYLDEEVLFVQSSIYLPSNSVFEDQATQRATERPHMAASVMSNAVRLRAAMLGLAIHSVPLIRDFYPAVGEVFAADFIAPFGYALATRHGSQLAEFNALAPGDWPPGWTLRVTGRRHTMHVDFPPSYVLSGSARAELAGPVSTQIFHEGSTGYEMLWLHIADVLEGRKEPAFSMEALTTDLDFAIALADGADRIMQEQ